MRTLIYKRTHCGDPDSEARVFGNHDCMGTVRGREFDAVIGIGGIRPWPKYNAIAGKLTWVGIGAHKIFDDTEIDTFKGGSDGSGPKLSPLRRPRVTFDDFWCPEAHGPLLEVEYPALARRMYVNMHVRAIMHSPSPVGEPEDTEFSCLDRDVRKILERARAESRSGQLANRDFQNTHTNADKTLVVGNNHFSWRRRSSAILAPPQCCGPLRLVLAAAQWSRSTRQNSRPAWFLAREGRPHCHEMERRTKVIARLDDFGPNPIDTGRFQINVTPEDADTVYVSESAARRSSATAISEILPPDRTR